MRVRLAASFAGLALVLAACGGATTEAGEDSGGGSGSQLTPVNIGYVPYADDVALFLAKEKGIFKKHGLDVTLTPAQSPTAVVASMVSGQQQFGFITTPVLINANAQGTPLNCVSTVDGQQTSDPNHDGTALVAAEGSGIESVEDLAGKTVAVVQLASLNAVDMQALALESNMAPDSFEMIQLPFPQMPAALAEGRVQAAVIVSPFLQLALDDGAQVISHPNVELFGGGTVVCFAATTQYIEEDPDTVEAFHAAMTEATVYAKSHQKEAKATLPKYLEVTPEQAQMQILSTNFDPALDLKSIEKMQSYMEELGLVSETVDPSDLVWAGAS
jgi:NitT/TauT family transport system substrate-binding protein